MERSPLHQQVDTLPDLVRQMMNKLVAIVDTTLPPVLCRQLERVFITGCGDSHHAAVATELAFEQLAGLPCEPMTAMQFARYAAGYLPESGQGTNLVLAVSVSGRVSRTAEALEMGRRAGGIAVAVTGNRNGAVAKEATSILETAVPPLPDELAGSVVPGTRSYVASLLALLLTAIQIGKGRGNLTQRQAKGLRSELVNIADQMERTIAACDPIARQTAEAWQDADQFVFCGAGPNYGTAMFSAAKLVEASGDVAMAQDLEEWAHLQYFGRQVNTPTFFISADGRDQSRAIEVTEAAETIGRRVATIAPTGSQLIQSRHRGVFFPVSGPFREAFSPLVTFLPGTLLAAYRAQLLDEPYFRDFGGGRSVEGGGGISRIRSSKRISEINHEGL